MRTAIKTLLVIAAITGYAVAQPTPDPDDSNNAGYHSGTDGDVPPTYRCTMTIRNGAVSISASECGPAQCCASSIPTRGYAVLQGYCKFNAPSGYTACHE
ncbi:hypothetical protein BCV70DRAFT_21835 [Testicularia cyperi]|uniref:Uncharacterized protein n=1 Tax=Testicularia cyperi TaxID=1882483 RepID=A0A317XZF7_9BASI|nr:hypothetical protein BCV70DRAFT_21835 [Testicularia cyperi]